MRTDLDFHPAALHALDEMAAIFSRGYEGYYTPVAMDAPAFLDMVRTSDIDLAASRVGSLAGRPVAFALLGVRGTRGWIGGMGVVPEARGAGYGRAVMDAVLEPARALGLEQVDLEVLEQNAFAIGIYEALGFTDRRRLEVLTRLPAPLPPGPESSGRATPDEVVTLDLGECLALYPRLHPERAPWQRDLPTLVHGAGRLAAAGVRAGHGIACYVIYRAVGGRLNLGDLAREAACPAATLARTLREIIAAHPEAMLTLLNLPADDSAGEILRDLGATVKFRQREMTRAL